MENLIHHYMTILRNRETGRVEFQEAAERLGHLMAQRSAEFVGVRGVKVSTPLDVVIEGKELGERVILCPILRSGLSLLPPFQTYFRGAPVGIIGLERDEESAVAHLYYCKLPRILEGDRVIILDPMLATGGSGKAAIELLMKAGVKEENILLSCLISCEEGRRAIEKKYPKVKVLFAEEDKSLNGKKFIVPGLGDFGDRFYGTI